MHSPHLPLHNSREISTNKGFITWSLLRHHKGLLSTSQDVSSDRLVNYERHISKQRHTERMNRNRVRRTSFGEKGLNSMISRKGTRWGHTIQICWRQWALEMTSRCSSVSLFSAQTSVISLHMLTQRFWWTKGVKSFSIPYIHTDEFSSFHDKGFNFGIASFSDLLSSLSLRSYRSISDYWGASAKECVLRGVGKGCWSRSPSRRVVMSSLKDDALAPRPQEWIALFHSM